MLGNTKYITLEGAKRMMAAAEAEATKNNWNVAIAILDAGGHLLIFQRLDGTQAGSVKIALGKATTALNFRRPTKMIEDLAATRPAFLALDGITPLQGGLPVIIDDQVIGAVGVSGVKSNEDEQVAQAAINALGK